MQPAGSRLAGLVSAHAVLRLAESRIRGKEGRPQDDQIAVPVPSGTNMPVGTVAQRDNNAGAVKGTQSSKSGGRAAGGSGGGGGGGGAGGGGDQLGRRHAACY